MAVRAKDLARIRAADHPDAAIGQGLAQQEPGGRVDLAVHQMAGAVHDRNLGAAGAQPRCRLETKEPAADDHSARARGCGGDHRVGVGVVAPRNDARKIRAGEGEGDRV